MASSSSSSSSSSPSSPARNRKRPAGRTKFRETRHPVFRGVRRRGRPGRCRWVCEVRVPGRRGCRLWLGTFDAAEAAARAHDAAMLALRAAADARCCLNFPDSAWRLHVPLPPPSPAPAALRDVRGAVARAVQGFLTLGPLADADDATSMCSATSEPSAAAANDDGAETQGAAAAPANAVLGQLRQQEEMSPFELDVLTDMGRGLYYACLAQGLLMEPPASDDNSWTWSGDTDDCDVVAAVPLWSY